MSERPDYMGDESHDEIVAGEYVLGVLSLEGRREVEARMAADPSFALRVQRWQDNLESFDEAYGDAKLPEGSFAVIERRLFGPQAVEPGVLARLWQSVAFWRAATLASVFVAFAIAATAVVLNVPPTPGMPLVAELSDANSALKLLAAYDGLSGKLTLTPIAGTPQEPKSLELWMIEGDGPALSMGVVSQDGRGELLVPADLRARINKGVTLAVSLEPLGGSPTGKATGPILAVGKIAP